MTTNLRLQSAALVVLLLVSYIGAPASAQEVQEDPKQPSIDNSVMQIYGTDDFSSCFSHFDGEDSTGSAEDGFGSRNTSELKSSNKSEKKMKYLFKTELK